MMGIAGIAAGGSHAASQQAMQSLAQPKHNHRHALSISDVDAQSSSVAASPNPTGRTGGKVDIIA